MKHALILALTIGLGAVAVAQAVPPAAIGDAPAPMSLATGAVPLTAAATWSCTPRKTCGRIGSCDEAYWYYRNCSWGGRLDGDSDGVPCESICR